MDKRKRPPHLMPVPDTSSPEGQAMYAEMEIDVMARTIWGEARGEGSAGMQAVAAVILNRVNIARELGGYWWGRDIIGVCHKPFQFSCWNKTDPGYRRVLSVTEDDLHFATAKRIARRAILGFIDDPTYGADHYHAKYVSPAWARGQRPTTVIGQHIFYQLVRLP